MKVLLDIRDDIAQGMSSDQLERLVNSLLDAHISEEYSSELLTKINILTELVIKLTSETKFKLDGITERLSNCNLSVQQPISSTLPDVSNISVELDTTNVDYDPVDYDEFINVEDELL